MVKARTIGARRCLTVPQEPADEAPIRDGSEQGASEEPYDHEERVRGQRFIEPPSRESPAECSHEEDEPISVKRAKYANAFP